MASDDDVDVMDDATLKEELKKLRKKMRKPEKTNIVIKSERKISKKFDGEKPSKFLDWLRVAQACIQGRAEEDQLDMIFNSLEGKALREVQRHTKDDRDTAQKILALLEAKYSDRRSSAQIRREFYALGQGAHSINEYSDLLVECLEGAEGALDLDNDGIERMLKEQFSENVTDSMLRWEMKRTLKEKIKGKEPTFDDLRNVALEFEAGQSAGRPKKGRMDEQSAGPNPMAQLTQAVEKLSTQIGDISTRLRTVEGRLNSRGRGNGSWQRRGGYRGYHGRGSYDNYQGQQEQPAEYRGYRGRGSYDNYQGQQEQPPNPGLDARAREFVPLPNQGQNQGNAQGPRR